MDPSLQHKFFEAGPCLSKEKLIQYHNGALSAKENNTIEKHVLECNLCNEALEGIAFSSAASGSIHEIDQNLKVLTGTVAAGSFLNWKSGLAMAATLVGVVFGMLWLLSDVHPDNNLVENKPKVEAKQVEKEITVSKNEVIEESINQEGASLENETIPTDKTPIARSKTPNEMEQVEAIESLAELEDDQEDLTGNGSALSGNLSFSGMVNDEPEEESLAMVEDIPQGEMKSIPAKLEVGSVDKEVVASSYNHSTLPTVYMNDLLVVDYSDIYSELDAVDQDQESDELMEAVTLQSVPAAYENDADYNEKARSRMGNAEVTIDYAYEKVLSEGLMKYKKEKYAQAIKDFNLILAKYPKDHNALFYKALSLSKREKYTAAIALFDEVYQLPQTPFQLDAEWNKALALIKNNEVEKGKQLLLKIKKEDNYYGSFAAKELEKM